MSKNVVEQFAPCPKDADKATAESVYKNLLVSAQVEYLRQDRADRPDFRLLAAEFCAVHLLRFLIGNYPDMANYAARGLWEVLDDGALSEWLWEWLVEAGIAPEEIDKAFEAVAQ